MSDTGRHRNILLTLGIVSIVVNVLPGLVCSLVPESPGIQDVLEVSVHAGKKSISVRVLFCFGVFISSDILTLQAFHAFMYVNQQGFRKSSRLVSRQGKIRKAYAACSQRRPRSSLYFEKVNSSLVSEFMALAGEQGIWVGR